MGCYYSYEYDVLPKVMFKHMQNTNVQSNDKSLLSPQTDFYTEAPPPVIPQNQAQTCTQVNNLNTLTLSVNKVNLDTGYNKQHMETPRISKSQVNWLRYVSFGKMVKYHDVMTLHFTLM